VLTPLDIHNREFKKSLRGYDIDDVDDFLDEIIKDFETLYKDNIDLQEEIKKQKENIERYHEIEETLQNTMVLAQKMAEEAKRNAEKETELAIWEARKKAEQIVSGAHDDVTNAIKQVETLKAYEKQMKVKLKSFLATQLELLEDNDLYRDDSIKEKREPEINDFMEDNRE
jgi:cell division initiation protein